MSTTSPDTQGAGRPDNADVVGRLAGARLTITRLLAGVKLVDMARDSRTWREPQGR